jgi:hypothetical protein
MALPATQAGISGWQTWLGRCRPGGWCEAFGAELLGEEESANVRAGGAGGGLRRRNLKPDPRHPSSDRKRRTVIFKNAESFRSSQSEYRLFRQTISSMTSND